MILHSGFGEKTLCGKNHGKRTMFVDLVNCPDCLREYRKNVKITIEELGITKRRK